MMHSLPIGRRTEETATDVLKWYFNSCLNRIEPRTWDPDARARLVNAINTTLTGSHGGDADIGVRYLMHVQAKAERMNSTSQYTARQLDSVVRDSLTCAMQRSRLKGPELLALSLLHENAYQRSHAHLKEDARAAGKAWEAAKKAGVPPELARELANQKIRCARHSRWNRLVTRAQPPPLPTELQKAGRLKSCKLLDYWHPSTVAENATESPDIPSTPAEGTATP